MNDSAASKSEILFPHPDDDDVKKLRKKHRFISSGVTKVVLFIGGFATFPLGIGFFALLYLVYISYYSGKKVAKELASHYPNVKQIKLVFDGKPTAHVLDMLSKPDEVVSDAHWQYSIPIQDTDTGTIFRRFVVGVNSGTGKTSGVVFQR